ncbi:15526_t:CDS:2, partial [Rhizophagus irregularis]
LSVKSRPVYELPFHNKLSNDLLNNTYKDVTENVNQYVKKTNLVLFWKTMKTKKKRHTGTFIAEQFDIVINEVGVDKVAAVLMDNASNMKAAHNILKAKYPNIFS